MGYSGYHLDGSNSLNEACTGATLTLTIRAYRRHVTSISTSPLLVVKAISEVDFGGGYNGRARSLEIAGKPIRTIRDLVLVTEEEALRNYNCGRKTVNRIKEVLAEHGLRFGMILE